MRCQTCHEQSGRIIVLNGVERCHNCAGFSEAGGTRTTGLITRNSFRVRSQATKYEKDTVAPHIYNKSTRRFEINPDFVKLYPEQTTDFTDAKEIRQSGLHKLSRLKKAKEVKKQLHEQRLAKAVEFHGDTTKAVRKAIK